MKNDRIQYSINNRPVVPAITACDKGIQSGALLKQDIKNVLDALRYTQRHSVDTEYGRGFIEALLTVAVALGIEPNP